MATKEPVGKQTGSEILEKIEKLALWQRVGIVAALMVLLFGAATWFVYLPLYDEITELDTKM